MKQDDPWCPENDAAYRAELAAQHRDTVEQRLHRARVHIKLLDTALHVRRCSALEEAAQLCDGYRGDPRVAAYDARAEAADDMARTLASAIRALKDNE
jgi:hypothetical protein